jgi:two-component system, LytTR family, response regulator
MKARAFIADDEPPARAKIRRFLERRDDVEVVGEAGDGIGAIEQVLLLRPDVLFLDIQMPRGDGFEVLREVYPLHQPAVVFATAYDQYAVRAFEVQALDYLLKPFTLDRFNAALDRALRGRAAPSAEPRLARLLEEIATHAVRPNRILVRENDRLFFLQAGEIEWVEAEEKYVLLHTRTRHHLIRESLTALEARLAPAGFVRIHRSHLLNLDALQEVLTQGRGDCIAVLRSGTRLNVGRNFKDRLLESMSR